MIGNQPLNRAQLDPQPFTLVAGQTAINANYTPGYEFVHLDGVLLKRGLDYSTNATGTTITLLTPALSGQECMVLAFGTFESANFYEKTAINAMLPRKNYIINGCMRKNSEGSASYTAIGYTLDQQRISMSGTTVVVTQESVPLGTVGLSEDTVNVKKTVVTSVVGVGNYILETYRIEGVRTLAGKQVTFALSGKADAAKSVAVEAMQYFGTGGSPSADVLTYVGQITLGTAYSRHELTITLPSVAGKTLGTDDNDHLNIYVWFEAGTDFDARTGSLGQQSGTFEITEAGLYEGDTAPTWECEDLAVLDTQCARFYWAFDGETSNWAMVAIGTEGKTAGACNGLIHLPVPMRVKPTAVISGVRFVDLAQITGSTPTALGDSFSTLILTCSNKSTAGQFTGDGTTIVLTADARL